MVKMTIPEWEKIYDVKIMDPDGFDRSNPNLMAELFTEDEFISGMLRSSIVGGKDFLNRVKERKK